MASLRETKNRIKSVKSTEKITRAMKMVAASKLRRAQEAVVKPRAYAQKLSELISALALRVEASNAKAHPLLYNRPHKKNVEILALTSDRGLCGALNSSVVRMTQRFVIDHDDEFENLSISTIGKKGFEGLTRAGFTIRKHYQPDAKVFDVSSANQIADELCARFLSKEIDAVYLIYNEFKSAITQQVAVEQLLPIVREELDSAHLPTDYLYEPAQEDLLESLVPRHFATRLYQSFLESFASEQGARMSAMDNATRNAKEMTEKLTLQYNRARQAAITKELMEIIGGAEAL
ncbi:MAG: ATP synthase F1 subunit gamma [Myxococcales bacterium]|nr:ATP synthase F1 subunit gamma [Myxococcales bacterium]USN51728.1 MAG: ATP synthase F1 subunit gamma [Myxococcales bacterium]